MATVDPYGLKDAQLLVKDAIERSRERHRRWNALEQLYRTGRTVESMEVSDVPPRLWSDLPGLTLDSINMALPHMNIIKATAMARSPGFVVEPYGGGDRAEQNAQIGKELLQYFFKRLRGLHVFRDMVQDMVNLGAGFCKVGWVFAEGEVEKEDDELREQLAELIRAEQREAILEDRSEKDTEELLDLVDTTKNVVMQDEPFLEYVSPYDIFVPVHARRLEEARWVAQRMTLPYDEVASNPAFSDTAIEELTPSQREDYASEREVEHDRSHSDHITREEDDPFAEVTIYEFYDMRSRKMKVFQEDAEHALYDDELPYSHRHTPFVMMRNHEDGGTRFWPFGDLENIASLQEQFNEFAFEQLDSARRAGNKYAVDSEALDDDMIQLLESNQSDVVVPMDLSNKSVRESIEALPRKATSPEIFQAKEESKLFMRDILGLNDFQTGGSGADRMSATAAAVMDGTASLRAADKQWQVEEAVSDAGLKMMLLCQEFLDTSTSLRIVGSMGGARWLNVSKRDLRGEFGVSVEGGSTQATNQATERQNSVQVITEVAPLLMEMGFDPTALLREALRGLDYDPDRMLKRMQPAAPQQPPGGGGGAGQQPAGPGAGAPRGGRRGGPPQQPTVPQEAQGGPPIPAAVAGDTVEGGA